jgi:hypothetical protein
VAISVTSHRLTRLFDNRGYQTLCLPAIQHHNPLAHNTITKPAQHPEPRRPARQHKQRGAAVHHTIEITVPGQTTGALLAELGKLDGVLTLSVVRGGSVKPAGDVVTVQTLNQEVDAVLALAAKASGARSSPAP